MEADELTKLSVQLGSNLNHDVSYLDFGLTGSLEELVMVAEFIARDLTEKARRKARELLATHQVPPLADDLVARLDEVVAGL